VFAVAETTADVVAALALIAGGLVLLLVLLIRTVKEVEK
jgi:hypothetical protein